MDYFVNWMKGIACFFIISSLVLHLIPNEKYQKYMKLFMGFLMIIFLLKPVGRLFSLDNIFESYMNDNSYNQMTSELEARLKGVEEDRQNIILAEYKEKISDGISEYLDGIDIDNMTRTEERKLPSAARDTLPMIDMELKDLSVTIDTNEASESFGQIVTMSLSVTKKGNQKNISVGTVTLGGNNAESQLLVMEIKNYLSDFYNLEKHNINVNIS